MSSSLRSAARREIRSTRASSWSSDRHASRPVDLGESRGREEQGREHLAGQLLPLRLGQGQGLVFQRGDLRTVLSASVARNNSITPSVTVRKRKAGARYV